jgi:hypothetical protein
MRLWLRFHGFGGLLMSASWIWAAGLLFVGVGISSAQTSYKVTVQPGFNSIANHLDPGSYKLDDVLRGVPEGSVLYKFNPATGGYELAHYMDGLWFPETEVLKPGEGAFLQLMGNQTITLTFTGRIAQSGPFRQVGLGRYHLVSAHEPRTMYFGELFGFAPHPGDVVYLYDKPFAADPSPGQQTGVSSTHRFSLRGWDIVPAFRVGRSAFVYLSEGPRVVQHPAPRTVNAGTNVVFNVGILGQGPLRYQWLLYEDELVGETNSTLTISNVQYWHSGLYSVTVRTPYGEATSKQASLRVNSQPVILESPENVRAIPGQKLTFRVKAVGTPVLRYQWFRNSEPLPNQQAPFLNVTASASTAGRYHVRVTNNLGFAFSQPATLEVNDPPKINIHPITQFARPNQTVVFAVFADGTPPLNYHWRHNGQRIARGTNSVLIVPNVQPRDAGVYDVVVANAVGFAQSESAELILDVMPIMFSDSFFEPPPPFFMEPEFTVRGDNLRGTREEGEPIHCERVSTNSVWMTWMSPEPGIVRFETSGSSFDTVLAAYTLDAASGFREVACDDDGGDAYGSRIVFVAVPKTIYYIAIDGLDGARGQILLDWQFKPTDEVLPIITEQPRDQTANTNDAVVFSVSPSPAGAPFQFQWYYNGTRIDGANESQLSIFPVREADVGYYQVVVFLGQQEVRSRRASLQISVEDVDNKLVRAFAVDKFADAVFRGPQIAPSPGGIQSIAATSFTPVFGYTGTQIFSTVGYSNELGELSHCGIAGGASAWFVLVATNNGQLYLNTAGSSFNTVLAVYTGPGPTIASLTAQKCDDDSGPGTTSSLDLPVIKNNIYYIAVDGLNGVSGSAHLNYRLLIPLTMTNVTKPNDTLCTFRVTATPSYPFKIQRCVGLSSWVDVLTTNRPNGIFNYSDTNATVEKRFYRVTQTP